MMPRSLLTQTRTRHEFIPWLEFCETTRGLTRIHATPSRELLRTLYVNLGFWKFVEWNSLSRRRGPMRMLLCFIMFYVGIYSSGRKPRKNLVRGRGTQPKGGYTFYLVSKYMSCLIEVPLFPKLCSSRCFTASSSNRHKSFWVRYHIVQYNVWG